MQSEYEIFMVSFRRKGENAYSVLSVSKGQKPEDWQLHQLKKYVESQHPPEEDYSDLF